MTKKKEEQPKSGSIKYQQVGRSLIVVIDKERHVLTTGDKEKIIKIKDQINSYNKLPSENKLEKLLRALKPKAEAQATKKKVEKKVKHQKVKKLKQEIKESTNREVSVQEALAVLENAKDNMSEDQVKQLEQVVSKNKKVAVAPAPEIPKRPGEH